MKRVFICIVLISVMISGICAENSRNQIAYRYLENYVEEKESKKGRETAGAVTMGVGGTLVAAGGVLWFAGDDITATINENNQPWSSSQKYITCGSLAGAGLITLGTGAAVYFIPPPDYRARFSEVFSEDDQQVREAMAAAALKDLAERGKRERIISGVTDASLPVITGGIQVATNIAQENPWYENVASVEVWQVYNLISGINEIFFERSKEEQIYAKYQTAQTVLGSQ